MKTVLIVCPHFPPINAPDMHRVRMSLPYFRESGWAPVVLAIRPEAQDLPTDASLMQFVPQDVPVHYCGAVPATLTRWCGIGSEGIRGWLHLLVAGSRLIRQHRVDVVYFSTTSFVVLALGRVWKALHGVPFVIDFQDPWYNTYGDDRPGHDRGRKYALAQQVHRQLERWTMSAVDRVIAVSPAYLTTLRERYSWLREDFGTTIPFGGAEGDFAVARRQAPARASADVRGVYVGAGGSAMRPAARIVLRSFRNGLESEPAFQRVRLEFLGTDYAPRSRATPTMAPIAVEEGVGDRVSESTDRLGYLDALRTLAAADFLLLIGSDDPQYSASKVYPYLLTGKPVIAVVHEQSPVLPLLRESAAIVVTFAGPEDVDGPAARLTSAWAGLLRDLPGYQPRLEPLQPFLAPALTRAQCAVLDAAACPAAPRSTGVPCLK